MKKYLLSVLALLVMGLSTKAQTVISNEYESTTTDVSNNESINTSHKLNPWDYGFFGLTYSADMEYIDKGVYGVGGHIFGSKGFGGSFTLGLNFDSALYQSKLGPNYCAPISKNAYFYIPLYAVLNGIYVDDEKEFGWGLDLVPSIGFKFGKFHIGAGLNLTWSEGSDEIRTGLTVNIGYTD